MVSVERDPSEIKLKEKTVIPLTTIEAILRQVYHEADLLPDLTHGQEITRNRALGTILRIAAEMEKLTGIKLKMMEDWELNMY